jgi:hypothetical protein
MRHDFADMIQVRYEHANGESYDTWVSGEEALQRLRSEDAEGHIRRLSGLSLDELRKLFRRLPDEGREHLNRDLRRRLGDSLSDFLGDSPIADALSDRARGTGQSPADDQDERGRWQALLQDDRFRAVVLSLAFIQLEGSLPEENRPGEPNDWV